MSSDLYQRPEGNRILHLEKQLAKEIERTEEFKKGLAASEDERNRLYGIIAAKEELIDQLKRTITTLESMLSKYEDL